MCYGVVKGKKLLAAFLKNIWLILVGWLSLHSEIEKRGLQKEFFSWFYEKSGGVVLG